MIRTIVDISWAMGMMLSPAALVLHGQLAGLNGIGFILPFVAVVVLYWISSRATREVEDTNSGEIRVLTGAFGVFGGTWLLLLARPAAAVGLVTSVLVTAGFVFNETIVYWFPNFAFAAILLLLVTGMNLAGEKVAAMAQVVFISVAIGGLVALLIIGGLTWPDAIQPNAPSHDGEGGLSLVFSGIWPAPLVLVGFEMVRYTSREWTPGNITLAMRAGILIAAVVFTLWNLWSLAFVHQSRLAHSTIPHILAAKAIAGPAGRYLIATVGIAGASALVNMLFFSISGMTARMAANGLLSRIWSGHGHRSILTLFLLGGMVAVMMALGFAGSNRLELLIRAAMILWLVFYAGVHLAHLIQMGKMKRQHTEAQKSNKRYHLIPAAMMLMAVVGLIFEYDRLLEMLKMILLIAVLSATTTWIALRWAASGRRPRFMFFAK